MSELMWVAAMPPCTIGVPSGAPLFINTATAGRTAGGSLGAVLPRIWTSASACAGCRGVAV